MAGQVIVLRLRDQDAQVDLGLDRIQEAAHCQDVQQHVSAHRLHAVSEVFNAMGDRSHLLGLGCR